MICKLVSKFYRLFSSRSNWLSELSQLKRSFFEQIFSSTGNFLTKKKQVREGVFLSNLKHIGTKGAFRKSLVSVSQNWRSWKSTKSVLFGSAGRRIPERSSAFASTAPLIRWWVAWKLHESVIIFSNMPYAPSLHK